MLYIILMAVVIILAAAVKVLATFDTRGGIAKGAYKSKQILTENEWEFYCRLETALPEYRVLTQVALGALLQPNVARANKKYMSIRGTFAQKIADFVICEKDFKVIAIIELDDRTHSADKDAKRDAMCEGAGYTVVRYNSKSKPSVEEIKIRIMSLTKVRNSPSESGATALSNVPTPPDATLS